MSGLQDFFLIKVLITQDRKRVLNVDDIRMNNSSDGHEIWFTNKDGEQILAARYEDVDLAQMAIDDYVCWLDNDKDETFAFLEEDLFKAVCKAREEALQLRAVTE